MCRDVGMSPDGPLRTPRSSSGSAMSARFSNRVMFFRKVSFTVPVAPLRFLATINSAMPGWSFGS